MEPNFFIVGAPKSGTTNISYYLKLNNQVFMPENLEPYYFSRLDIPKNYQREIISDRKIYLNLFKNAKFCKAIGESSPVYLYSPHSAECIKKEFPESKIIISLRNPVEITYSQYYSLKFMNYHNDKNFDEIIDADKERILRNEFYMDSLLEAGFYSKHIKRFQKIFEPNQIKIIIFEEYIQDINSNINSIFKFLGVNKLKNLTEQDKGAYKIPKNFLSKQILTNKIIRKSLQKVFPTVTRQKFGEKFLVKESKKPEMPLQDRIKVKKIYERDVEQTKRLLNRELPWADFN